MEDYKKSYCREAVAQLRYVEESATPVTEAQLMSVLGGASGVATDARYPLGAAIAARDGAVLSIALLTMMMRGHEVGGLRLSGLPLTDGSSAFPVLAPLLLLRPGDKWLIKPTSSKTVAANEVQPRRVHFGDVAHCLSPPCGCSGPSRLAWCTSPLAGTCSGVWPGDRQGFQEAPLTSAALNYMFKKRLVDAGVLAGQTPHGNRRGAIEACVASRRSREEVMAQANTRTPRVFERYTDPFRYMRDR